MQRFPWRTLSLSGATLLLLIIMIQGALTTPYEEEDILSSTRILSAPTLIPTQESNTSGASLANDGARGGGATKRSQSSLAVNPSAATWAGADATSIDDIFLNSDSELQTIDSASSFDPDMDGSDAAISTSLDQI